MASGMLLMIIGIIVLFNAKPIPFTSFEQKQLYESNLYQHLEKIGIATRAIVSSAIKQTESTTNLWVKFFTRDGQSTQAYIPLTKQPHHEGDLINIIYNPENAQQARIAPREEMQLNWPLFGWCLVIGLTLFWLGYFRYKISGGIE